MTYPNHSNFIPAKNQNVSINFYRCEFGHWDLWIGRHPIPRLVLHHHREGGELRSAQVAALGYDVGARALEVVGGVVKCVVMWISRDGADAFSKRLTWSHVVFHRTRLIRTTRGLLTLHLIWKTHLITHRFQGVIPKFFIPWKLLTLLDITRIFQKHLICVKWSFNFFKQGLLFR